MRDSDFSHPKISEKYSGGVSVAENKIEAEPFFGYLRGPYSIAEMKQLEEMVAPEMVETPSSAASSSLGGISC